MTNVEFNKDLMLKFGNSLSPSYKPNSCLILDNVKVTLSHKMDRYSTRAEKGVLVRVEGIYGTTTRTVTYTLASSAGVDYEKTLRKVRARVAFVQKVAEDYKAQQSKEAQVADKNHDQERRLVKALKDLGLTFPDVKCAQGQVVEVRFTFKRDAIKVLELLGVTSKASE